MRPQLREQIYAAIDGERDYQNALGGDRTNGTQLGVSGCLTLLSTYLRKAQDAWTDNPSDTQALHEIRKLAAICVRAMEEHGAPERR
jgi:hypothetical protein